MKKIILSLIFLAGCAPAVPTIQETVIDEEFFEYDGGDPFAEVPFSVEIPDGWELSETPPEYILTYDDGVSGKIVFNKNVFTSSVVFEEFGAECVELACSVMMPGTTDYYSFIINDKGFSVERLEEVEEIVNSITFSEEQ